MINERFRRGQMRYMTIVAAICFVMFVFSCSGDPAELYDTAQFEEKQNNREHAGRLYEEIVKKYPDSPVAAKAKERLAVLRPAGAEVK